MFPVQKVTVYHNNGSKWVSNVLVASFRQTSSLNRTERQSERQNINQQDVVTVRFFKADNYDGFEEFIANKDVVVSFEVSDEVDRPLTELQAKYGKDKVFKINGITVNFFDTQLDHVKVECI